MFKHVLNTRLMPVVSHSRARRMSREHPVWIARSLGPIPIAGRLMKLQLDIAQGGGSVPLSENDPLPPEDRVTAGLRPSLEVLYRTQAPRLLRLFSRRVEKQDAGDLVQESFVRLAQSEATRSVPIEVPVQYLGQIAKNLMRDRAREAYQRSVSPPLPDEQNYPVALDMASALEARDMLNRLQTAMMRLSPKTREIFMAHPLDGMTYAEIAEQTGLSVKGVEWHMSKAIDHLFRVAGIR